METVLSTFVGGNTITSQSLMEETEMSIAEYIMLMRDALNQSGSVEAAPSAAGGVSADRLQEIIVNMNSVVTKDEIKEAITKYRQAVMANPDDAESYFRPGMSYLLLNNKRSAHEVYKVLKKLDPLRGDELLQRWNVCVPWSHRY